MLNLSTLHEAVQTVQRQHPMLCPGGVILACILLDRSALQLHSKVLQEEPLLALASRASWCACTASRFHVAVTAEHLPSQMP